MRAITIATLLLAVGFVPGLAQAGLVCVGNTCYGSVDCWSMGADVDVRCQQLLFVAPFDNYEQVTCDFGASGYLLAADCYVLAILNAGPVHYFFWDPDVFVGLLDTGLVPDPEVCTTDLGCRSVTLP